MTTAKSYKLKVTETGRKGNKYHYQVIDELGNVISERRSDRVYAACTINGSHYFGRADLVGKGDHGRLVRWCVENNKPITQVAYLEQSAK
jgi:hypothetical protein